MNRRSVIFRRVSDTAIASAIALTSLFTAAYGALAPGDPARGVAVIYAPWVGFDAAFLRSVEAGARFVRAGGLPFVVVVVPDDPDFERRVKAAGAWMLADPVALAGCLSVVTAGRVS